MSHLWSGRFDGDPDAALLEFGASFAFDRRLFEDDVRGSLAWAAALADAGVLSLPDAERIRAGLEEILARRSSPPTPPGTTRTCTPSWSASWCRGSATRGDGSIRAARATSRCRSTRACI
jgi:hypothetical protein